MVKFKVDENLPMEAAALLRHAGHDAVTVLEQHIGGAPDRDVAAVCKCEERALVTLDIGFADIRTYPPNGFPGLVVLRLNRQSKSDVLETLRRLLPLLGQEALEGHLWIVERNRVRVRH